MKLSPIFIVIFVILHFTAASLIPVYNKELFFAHPYPLYATFVQMFFSTIPTFFIAWCAQGFPCSLRWAIPPYSIVYKLIISSFLYGGMMLTGNLGFYVSDLDFAVLFRLSTIASSGLCGIIFLHERISFIGCIAIIFVLCGLFALASNFQWSTAKMPTKDQFIVQILAVFTSSFASLTLKKTIHSLEDTSDGHEPFTMLFWRFLLGSFPVLISSLLIESGVFINLEYINTKSFLYWTLVGIALSGTYQILNIVLHGATAMVTLTVVSQMKFLPTLIISHIRYKETQWTKQQLIGAALLLIGALVYSLTRAECGEKEIDQEKIDSVESSGSSIRIEVDNFSSDLENV